MGVGRGGLIVGITKMDANIYNIYCSFLRMEHDTYAKKYRKVCCVFMPYKSPYQPQTLYEEIRIGYDGMIRFGRFWKRCEMIKEVYGW